VVRGGVGATVGFGEPGRRDRLPPATGADARMRRGRTGAVGADRWAPTTVRQRRQGRQAADMWAPPIVPGLNFPQFGQNQSNPIKFQFQTRSNFD
jgi:hypothetical protein